MDLIAGGSRERNYGEYLKFVDKKFMVHFSFSFSSSLPPSRASHYIGFMKLKKAEKV